MTTHLHRFAGYFLITAAVTFWVAWFLMPDQGTVDTLHILNIVKENREAVLASVVVQIISSILYLPALLGIAASIGTLSRATFWGITLLGIGAMGMCADAFFHLLAYFMTDSAIQLNSDVVRVMEFMQTKGILFLIPLLLPFFVGTLVLALGLYKQHVVSRAPMLIALGAFVVGIVGAVIVNGVLGYGRPVLVLTVLAIFALSQMVIGRDYVKLRSDPNARLG